MSEKEIRDTIENILGQYDVANMDSMTTIALVVEFEDTFDITLPDIFLQEAGFDDTDVLCNIISERLEKNK